MHLLVLEVFKFLKNIAYFLNITGIFYVMMLAIYWIQNIIGAAWNWLNFIKPSLDYLLSISACILPFTFSTTYKELDFKYFGALLLLTLWIFVFRFLYMGLEMLQDTYEYAHLLHKKSVENNFNKKLKNVVIKEEKKIKSYQVFINTKIKKKFSHKELNVDINHLNNLMNDYIHEKTGETYLSFKSGFLYTFNDFEKIDNTIDVLFKLINDNSPIEYSISLQCGDNLKQLAKIASFEIYNKIIFAADTLLRYKVNKTHRYQTLNIGIFQCGKGSIELHEFQKIV